MLESSANKIYINIVDTLHKSLIYIHILNSFGPRTDHGGIPHFIVLCSELVIYAHKLFYVT